MVFNIFDRQLSGLQDRSLICELTITKKTQFSNFNNLHYGQRSVAFRPILTNSLALSKYFVDKRKDFIIQMSLKC